MTKREQAERQEAIDMLRKMIQPGDRVYTSIVHVSRSGMSRDVRVFVADEHKQIASITGLVGRAIGARIRRGWTDAIAVGGCGFDAGFQVVYELSRALHPGGFGCAGDGGEDHGKRCPSNDHSNGDRDYRPHTAGAPDALGDGPCGKGAHPYGTAVCHWHRDGGYSLRHESL